MARAHRRQRMLESGECASITELAAAEKIVRSYFCRVLRLTLLALEIVEAILDGGSRQSCSWTRCLSHFQWSGNGSKKAGAAHSSDPLHAFVHTSMLRDSSGEHGVLRLVGYKQSYMAQTPKSHLLGTTTQASSVP